MLRWPRAQAVNTQMSENCAALVARKTPICNKWLRCDACSKHSAHSLGLCPSGTVSPRALIQKARLGRSAPLPCHQSRDVMRKIRVAAARAHFSMRRISCETVASKTTSCTHCLIFCCKNPSCKYNLGSQMEISSRPQREAPNFQIETQAGHADQY